MHQHKVIDKKISVVCVTAVFSVNTKIQSTTSVAVVVFFTDPPMQQILNMYLFGVANFVVCRSLFFFNLQYVATDGNQRSVSYNGCQGTNHKP